MPGKSLTPDQIAEAVTLRAAGYTVTAISERLAVSVRTLNRVFERHGTTKGAVKDELVEQARKVLVTAITENDEIRAEAGRIVADDLAHARLLRERMAIAAEHLTATNLDEAALVMRAAAAYSTAIKNTSDMLRHSLRTDRALDAVESGDLPALTIIEISAEDALRMRQNASAETDGAPDGALPAPTAEAPSEPATEENERVSEGDDDVA